MAYDKVPGIDETNNFPPPVRAALLNSSEGRAAIQTQVADRVPPEVAAAIAEDSTLVQAAIDALSNAKAIVHRGIAPNGTDFNARTGSEYNGIIYISGTAAYESMTGLPSGNAGAAIVQSYSADVAGYSHTVQWLSISGYTSALYWRTLKTTGVWNDWKQIAVPDLEDNVYYRGFIPDGQNLSDMYGYEFRGQWYIRDTAHAQTLLDVPEGLAAGTVQIVSGEANYNHTTQMISVNSSSPALWFRVSRTTKQFTPWVNLMAGGNDSGGFALDRGHYGTPNVQLISDFEARHPKVSTGNRAAFAFRFDHGLTFLKSNILPELQARGWKGIVAMNSRNWEKDENSGMTRAQLGSYVSSGILEVGNHTADGNMEGSHKDMDTKDELWDGIVVGKRELEAQIGHPVEHFIVPGTVNGMGGFAQGASMDVYSSTYAGSLILAHHAVASGGYGEIYRVLDGRTKQCQRHWNIEKQTVSAIKSRIDENVNRKTGLQLMLHPRNIDQPGYLTMTQLVEVFDYIQTKVSNGQAVVLGTSELVRATLGSVE